MIKRKLISSALRLALVMTVAGCGNAKIKVTVNKIIHR